jgi:hypothetical protein
VTGFLIFAIYELTNNGDIHPAAVLAFIVFFGIIWIWIVFGELRTKVVKVELYENEIILSRYFGIGKKEVYRVPEFEKFEISLVPSKYDTYEFLSLVSNGKKVIRLSSYYHKNYADLKFALIARLKDPGQRL